ncbi:MAG: hypothetical protein RBT68_14495, partial [Spirochaetia bacterium]|nr:hypothetical protein [Spirochaetia bacterium]
MNPTPDLAASDSVPGKPAWFSPNLLPGILACLAIAFTARYAGILLPVVGGAVFGILFGMI